MNEMIKEAEEAVEKSNGIFNALQETYQQAEHNLQETKNAVLQASIEVEACNRVLAMVQRLANPDEDAEVPTKKDESQPDNVEPIRHTPKQVAPIEREKACATK